MAFFNKFTKDDTPIDSSASVKKLDKNTKFAIERGKKLANIYADDIAVKNRYDQSVSSGATTYNSASAVRAALKSAITNRQSLVNTSRELYAINPIYASIIDYFANFSMWRYKVTPHTVFNKSKAKRRKEPDQESYSLYYDQMLEVVDGLSIETKFPALLTMLYINGAVYFTTYCDPDSLTINTIILPDKYCRKIGETQYGTIIISFDLSYFDNLGLTADQLNELFKGFPKEMKSLYNAYKKDSTKQWAELDPFFSSGVLLNEFSIPTLFYVYGSIINYEQYQDNELEHNQNLLKYLVVQKMPTYQTELVFEPEEVKALHQSMKKVIEKNNNVTLLTTYGDAHVERFAEEAAADSDALAKAYNSIFNNIGLNNGLFTGDSVTALNISLVRDKGRVQKYINSFLNFYTIAINNWFDFKDYQVDIEILPISPYTYNEDIKSYKDNATLGVGKLDFFIASGVKQKNIKDQLYLEEYLGLNNIQPMQTSYTQTGENTEEDVAEDTSSTEASTENSTEDSTSSNAN